MSEIIFRIPSLKVRYGYVEVKGTHAEMGVSSPVNPEGVAKQYVWYVKQFAAAEEAAMSGEEEARDLRKILGLPSVPSTPPTEDEITDLVSEVLGGKVISTEPNSWDASAATAVPAKPWEAAAKAAPVSDDWDFG